MSQATLERFFAAFADRDGQTMAECYHPNASFFDPVFGRLEGERVGAMWKMLTSAAEELDLTVVTLEAGDQAGSATWVAVYPFGATGRRVTNQVSSAFEFNDGLIVRQVDRFSFAGWSRQALGPMGLLFGWVPLFRRRVRMLANSQLDRFSRSA